jgi:glycosyltransferase involved in cell wall biosynthesis
MMVSGLTIMINDCNANVFHWGRSISMRDVGIVMPVYIQEPSYLRTALRSILRQSYGNYTLVIVIDGAPANIVQIVREEIRSDDRIEILIKEKNQGVAKALNTGFTQLMHRQEIKYLTWVSSDNIYYPTFISKLRDTLERGTDNLGLVYSSFRHIDPNGQSKQSEKELIQFRTYQNKPKECLLDVCFIGVSFMYKKKYAALIDGYILEPVEDYEYWLRLTEHCDIEYIPLELMDYRVNSPHSISAQLRHSKNQHRRWQYAFNLAKQQTRNRRHIPFETTILFPVQDGSEKTVEEFGKLLDQSAYPPFYSNYKIVVFDISPNTSAIPVLQHISDPRVTLLARPSANEKEVIKMGVHGANTPFTMLYGKDNFPSNPYVFYNLVLQHRKLAETALSKEVIATFEKHPRTVGYRTLPASAEPIFGELYRTDKLLEILN